MPEPRRSTVSAFAGLALALALGVDPAEADLGRRAEADRESFASEVAIPSRLDYRGRAVGADGAPLHGRFQVDVRYYDAGVERALLRERHADVVVADGSFALALGAGRALRGDSSAAVGSVRDLFARHPEVEMELSIGGVRQAPRVVLLPAGHSPESRLVLAGKASANDGKPHSEGYAARSGASAVQAVVLRPAGAAGAAGSASSPRAAGGSHGGRGPFEIEMLGPWRSRPLRELPARAAVLRGDAEELSDESEETNEIRHEDLFDARGVRFGTGTEKIVDPLAALSASPSAARSPIRTPALAVDFAGIGNINGLLPPDTTGAVGPDHYVQVVNVSFQVFSKSGASVGGPYNTNVLWSGFGGPCETLNDGDAIFLYDRYASRWLLSQFAVSGGAQRVCFAVSHGPDPLGSYDLYELVTQRFPDYFKLGTWPDPANNAYLMTTNTGFQGAYDVYAIDRERMLAGLPARPAIFFQSFANLLMPADANGPRLPPPGSSGLLYTFRDGGEPYFGNPANDSLDLYAFHVDWTTPASSTFTLAESFTPPSGGFAAFNWSVCGFFESNCLDQPDTAQGLDSASWWPMHRLQYRRFEEHEALVGSWTVDVTGTPDHAAPRWFELRRTDGDWSIHQQGTHAPDAAHRWMPSIAMDGDGNIGLGYSAMDADIGLHASIRYATRAAGDALGTLQTEQTLVTGTGAQTHTAARWGDYSSMTVDPADDCTFWYTNEYLATTGNAPWLTRVGAFRYPGCGGLVVTPTLQRVCGAKGEIAFDVELSEKFDATTDLALTGCPPGATCGFSVNPVISPDAASALEISNLDAVATGVYALGVEASEQGNPADVFATAVGLEVWEAVPGALSQSAPANAAANQPLKPTFSWSSTNVGDDYELQVATDPGFTNLVYTKSLHSTSHPLATNLASSSTFYWRVRASNACGGGPWSPIRWFTTLAIATDCPAGKAASPVYTYGFESGANGWTSSGDGDSWAQSAARVHSGSASWHADDPEGVSDQRLVSPEIALPAGTPLSLRFWNYQSIERQNATSCYDGAILEVSTNGGNNFSQVTAGLLTDPYDGTIPAAYSNPLKNKSAWCGDPQDWLRSIVDLSTYAGQGVVLRFRLGSDTIAGREGWYLDDVEVVTCAVDPVIFVDGFETENATRWSSSGP